MRFVLLFFAGLFEVGWAIGMPMTDGFRRPLPTFLTVLCIVASMGLLALAARTIPIGTAYAIWVAIGVVGTTLYGVFRNGDPLTPSRMLALSLLLGSVIWLEITAPAPRPSA